MLWLIAAAAILVIIIVVVLVMRPGSSQQAGAPSDIVLRLYPAVKAKDNAALANILADEPKRLCGSDLVRCLQVPIEQFESYAISGTSLSTDKLSATVGLVIHQRNNARDLCQNFLVIQTDVGWRILKDTGAGLASCTPSTIPVQTAPVVDPTAPNIDQMIDINKTLAADAKTVYAIDTKESLQRTQTATAASASKR